ncbi:MAG: energy transducer TonB [Myxococcales bacterium]|nr:energy transducer TonB [Myxococcales bacterium]
MTQNQTRKILRIGIIQGGKIIEERLLRKREPVTVGDSNRNTFVIPGTSLPSRFPLFELKGDTYYLTIADWMTGRLSLGTGVADLQALKQEGVAKQVGQVDYEKPDQNGQKKKVPVFQVSLSEKSRGKLTFGDTTLLFQFVTPPPLPAKPQLPALVQGGWIKGIDWVYSTILVVSGLAHLGFIAYLRTYPIDQEIALGQISDRFAKYIAPIKPPPVPVKPNKTDEGKSAKKGDKSKKKSKGPKKRPAPSRRKAPARRLSDSEKAARAAARRRNIEEKLARVSVLGLLGAKNGEGSPIKDVLAGGGEMEKDLDKALKNAQGVAIDNGSGVRRGSRGGGGKRGSLDVAGSLRGPSGGAGVAGGGTGRRGASIKAKLKIENFEPEGGTLDQAALRRKIRIYQRGIRYCYERQLKNNPDLQGKLSLRITIALNGRVSSVEIEENGLNSAVGSCVKNAAKRWSFPKPKDDAVTIVLPLVFSPSR